MEPTINLSPHFTLESLAEGVYAAIANTGSIAASNSGIIDLGDQSLIFDTFLTPRAASDLRTAAENYTHRSLSYAINSHWHNDHIRGNQVFLPETEILSTRTTRALMETRGNAEVQEDAETAPRRLREFEDSALTETDPARRDEHLLWASYYRALAETAPRVKLRLPSWVFEGRVSFFGNKGSADLIEIGPAHSENDSVLFMPGPRVLFSADLIFVQSHPYLGESDPHTWLAALDRLEALEPERIVPGHGPVGGLDDLQRTRGYIMHIQELARWLVERGDPIDTVAKQPVPQAYARWKLERFYHANLSAFYQREMQKTIRKTGEPRS